MNLAVIGPREAYQLHAGGSQRSFPDAVANISSDVRGRKECIYYMICLRMLRGGPSTRRVTVARRCGAWLNEFVSQLPFASYAPDRRDPAHQRFQRSVRAHRRATRVAFARWVAARHRVEFRCFCERTRLNGSKRRLVASPRDSGSSTPIAGLALWDSEEVAGPKTALPRAFGGHPAAWQQSPMRSPGPRVQAQKMWWTPTSGARIARWRPVCC